MGQLGQLLLHGGNDFRVQVTGVQYRDTAREVDELTTFNVGNGGVFRRFGKDRVDLANTARNSGFTAFHQGCVGLVAHGVPHSPLIKRRGSRLTRQADTHASMR